MTATADVLVIGAGMAGLAAGRALHRQGLEVQVLEARDRVGGRAATLHPPGLPAPIELGPEFVHGVPPLTCSLVAAAGLGSREVEARHLCLEGGRLIGCEARFEAALEKLVDAAEDVPFRSWAEAAQRRGALRPEERSLATSYVEGFYAAEVERASALAIAEGEKATERLQGERNFRLDDGYGALARWLAEALPVSFGCAADRIEWSPGRVEVRCADGRRFGGRQAILALPLAVLQRGWAPVLDPDPGREADLARLEMGDVCKLTLRFRQVFWAGRLPAPCFVHVPGGAFPTWWCSWPDPAPVLVAWAGGGAARRLRARSGGRLAEAAIAEAAQLLGVQEALVRRELVQVYHHDWTEDAYCGGAYTSLLVGGIEAQRRAAAPLADTLFFAGEWTDFENVGTVTGALCSGERAASELLDAAAWQQVTR